MGLCLLIFTKLFLKIKRSESRSAGRKRILTSNSHSRSFCHSFRNMLQADRG